MHNVTCSYCEAEVTLDEIEKEGGCCPECGMIMGANLLLVDDDDEDDDLDDFDDEAFDDEE